MKIKKIEFCSIVMILMISNFLGNGIYALLKNSHNDSYIAILLSMIVGLIVLYIFLSIFKYKPELKISEKINYLFHKPFNYIINFIVTLLAFLFLTINLYSIISFINSQFLSSTPPLIFYILISLLLIFINSKGLGNIAKTTYILTIILLFYITISNLSLINVIKIDNLKPILINGIPIKGVIFSIALNILPIFILLVIPRDKISDNKNINRFILITYILSILIMTIIIIFIICTLGYKLASYYLYPEYIMLEKINIFNFLNKLENILDIGWIFGLFSSCTISLYYINNSIKLFNKKIINSTIYMLIAVFICIFIFKNITFYVNFVYNLIPIILIVSLFTHIIIFIKIKIDQRSIS